MGRVRWEGGEHVEHKSMRDRLPLFDGKERGSSGGKAVLRRGFGM